MALSVEAKIVNGLIEHFNGITLPTGVRVALPNTNFTKPTGVVGGKQVPLPYVALMVRKNTPQNAHIGGGVEPIRQGFLLANVCWPVGQGVVKPSELAGEIRDRFAFGTAISHDGINIRVIEEPTVQGDEQGPVYSTTPVVIPWRVFP